MRTHTAIISVAVAATVVAASSAIAVVAHRPGGKPTGSGSAPIGASPTTSGSPTTSAADSASTSRTHWHYAANSNFGPSGRYLPGAVGFNLGDVDSVRQLNSLPTGVLGLVWLGYCGGADNTFRAMVSPMIGDPRLFGFYMADDPDPTSCPPANLSAEGAWIHRHLPGAKTFAILENQGSATSPAFGTAYTPRSSGLDLIGLDAYPLRSDLAWPNYGAIGAYVRAAEALGWPQSSLVPVFQAFGGGHWGGVTWTLPTPAEERQILTTWARVLPAPVFDYAYSWGQQRGDLSLSMSPALQQVFAAHNE